MKYAINGIYNVDSYKAIKDIPDKSVDCIYTDIPYLYQKGGSGSSGSSALAQRIQKIQHKDLVGIIDGIDYGILDEFVRVSKKINIFIWCSKLQILDIMNWFNENTEVNTEILVWGKTNPTPATNNVWLPDLEYCLYFREKGVKLNDGYDLKSKYHITSINKQDKDLYKHPTIKPLELVKRHILHTTQEGDVIFDPFIGSGTTAVASQETGRNFIGFEIDKKWCDIANDRVNGIDATGQTSIFTDFDNIERSEKY